MEAGELRRGENPAVRFLQAEHRKVLSGLHEEVQRLQQKCSDLQFALSSATSSEQAEADLRIHVQELQSEVEVRGETIVDLESHLEKASDQNEDLIQQLKWKEVEFENELKSKESKIENLQRSLQVQGDIGRLQSACKKLYEEREQEYEVKMKDVVEKAKSPSERASVTSRQTLSRSMSVMEHSVPTRPMPVIRPLPDLSTTRSKLFRHKLQKSLKNAPVDKFDPLATDLLLCSLDERQLKYHRASLPGDYRSTVATLPPIAANRPNSVATGYTRVETIDIASQIRPVSSRKDSKSNENSSKVLHISTTESMA